MFLVRLTSLRLRTSHLKFLCLIRFCSKSPVPMCIFILRTARSRVRSYESLWRMLDFSSVFLISYLYRSISICAMIFYLCLGIMILTQGELLLHDFRQKFILFRVCFFLRVLGVNVLLNKGYSLGQLSIQKLHIACIMLIIIPLHRNRCWSINDSIFLPLSLSTSSSLCSFSYIYFPI